MKRGFRISYVLLVLCVLSVLLPGKEPEKKQKVFIELSAAFSNLNPRDLNSLAEARQGYVNLNFRAHMDYLHQLYGEDFTYSLDEATDSGLKQIRSGFPLNFRLGYRLGSRISLYAGLQFVHRRQNSRLQQTYLIADFRPDQVSQASNMQELNYPDFMLGAQAWIPQLGIRLDLVNGPSWSGGVWLAAGPMFASIRAIEEHSEKTTYSDGYWSEKAYLYDMKGTGSGFSMEGGVRIMASLASRLSLSLEGGYAWRRAGNFNGPGHYESQNRDSNAAENLNTYDWVGKWYKQKYEYHQPWGNLTSALPGNYFSPSSSDLQPFHLDLSGLQLALGLVFYL